MYLFNLYSVDKIDVLFYYVVVFRFSAVKSSWCYFLLKLMASVNVEQVFQRVRNGYIRHIRVRILWGWNLRVYNILKRRKQYLRLIPFTSKSLTNGEWLYNNNTHTQWPTKITLRSLFPSACCAIMIRDAAATARGMQL